MLCYCVNGSDEETTMSGAENVAPYPFLTAKSMINLDSEESYDLWWLLIG